MRIPARMSPVLSPMYGISPVMSPVSPVITPYGMGMMPAKLPKGTNAFFIPPMGRPVNRDANKIFDFLNGLYGTVSDTELTSIKSDIDNLPATVSDKASLEAEYKRLHGIALTLENLKREFNELKMHYTRRNHNGMMRNGYQMGGNHNVMMPYMHHNMHHNMDNIMMRFAFKNMDDIMKMKQYNTDRDALRSKVNAAKAPVVATATATTTATTTATATTATPTPTTTPTTTTPTTTPTTTTTTSLTGGGISTVTQTISSIGGGDFYKHKYLKYKMRYLNLGN
jgi:hypothetical protein